MKERRALNMPPRVYLTPVLLLALLSGKGVLSICPPMCSCERGHRTVDCSSRGQSHLPDGLQHNIRSLNLSHNRLHNLDGRLDHFTHLRSLDLSYNRLLRLPAGLPRALWEVHASGNRLRQLDKNDTAYHWNLRTLDLSANKLERVVFINNTLTSLLSLNLSHNKFWTVPTNMPANLETVDLSHNYLVQILPGSLDRMGRLAHLYLHRNHFVVLNGQVFSQLWSLHLLTLYDNPWACEEAQELQGLLDWTRRTSARVLGCPCHTHPVCGEAYLTSTGAWHFASYTHGPLGANARHAHTSRPPMQAITSGFLTKSALLIPNPSHIPLGHNGDPAPSLSYHPALNATLPPFSTYESTTPRLRKAGKVEGGAGLGVSHSTSDGLKALPPCFITLTLFLLSIFLKNI
ncbi:hypothetical protein GJAV_G00061160 [Gymnothorax javanicus]|nr:hypothetical protein GJAV_G00061160 [Gymnothorax javanicus]